jgi:ADP-ribose pyrophosphatase YjhB (NUDIX family)
MPLSKDDMMNFCSSCGEAVSRKIPDDDNRERWVCQSCGKIHYQNPLVVVGCVPERDGKILLCKRAIEPRYGYWTVPAGFMELGESSAQGSARETLEEACAEVEIGHLFALVDVIDAGQVHLFYTAKLLSDFKPGAESLDVAMFAEDEIPWDDIAFHSGRYALKKYFEDKGENNGAHVHELRRAKS